MGTLSIRMASERLGNIGSVGQVYIPNLTGLADERMRDNERIFQNLVNGAEVGARGSAGIYFAIQQKEDNRKVDMYVSDVQNQYNKEMYGDGSQGSGKMNEDFTDGFKWMKDNDQIYNKVENEVQKRVQLNDRQKKMAAQALSSYKTNWQTRQAEKANAIYEKSRQESASMRLANAAENVKLGMDQDSIDEWMRSVDNSLDVMRIHDEDARANFKKIEGLKLFSSMYNTQALNIRNEANIIENVDEVSKFYDKKIAEAKELPQQMFSWYGIQKNVIGEEASDRLNKQYVSGLIDAKKSAIDHVKTVLFEEKKKQIEGEQTLITEFQLDNKFLTSDIPNKQVIYNRIDGLDKIGELEKNKLKAEWSRMFAQKEKLKQDQREHIGYFDKDTNMWINPTSWAKETDPSLIEKLNEPYIANNPDKGISIVKSAMATGSITYSDYKDKMTRFTALLYDEITSVCIDGFGEKYKEAILSSAGYTKDDRGNRVNQNPSYGEGWFKDALYYQKGENSNEGSKFDISSITKWGSNYDFYEDIKKKDKANEHTISLDELRLMIDFVKGQRIQGVPKDKIVDVLKGVIAPSVEKYYNMTFTERLMSQEFAQFITDDLADRKRDDIRRTEEMARMKGVDTSSMLKYFKESSSDNYEQKKGN